MAHRQTYKSQTHIKSVERKCPYSVCMFSLSPSRRHSWCGPQWGLRDERNHPAKICANGSSETLTALANSRERMRDGECRGREEEMTGKRMDDKPERK